MKTIILSLAAVAASAASAQTDAPALAADQAPAADKSGVVVFHDTPFVHPVSLLLRAIDPATGEFGAATIIVASTDFAAGSGRLHAAAEAATINQFHAAALAPGSYAMIGKIERIPDGDVVKVWSTCFPKGADIFTLAEGERVLVAAPMSMTFDVASMQSQLEQYLKAGEAGRLEQDFAAILAANPSFAGDYRAAAPVHSVSFKMTKSKGDEEPCLKPGAAKGKIIPYTAPGVK